ncbi:MAG: hypothetical protein WCO11_08195 [Sphingomonadales bacterium]|jgi:hypothetical protein
MNFLIEFFGRNGDSHETFDLKIEAKTENAAAVSEANAFAPAPSISDVVNFIKLLIGDEEAKGPIYDEVRQALCKMAFTKCGWNDVKVSLGKILADGKCINQSIIDDENNLEEFTENFQYTLVHYDNTMWFWD